MQSRQKRVLGYSHQPQQGEAPPTRQGEATPILGRPRPPNREATPTSPALAQAETGKPVGELGSSKLVVPGLYPETALGPVSCSAGTPRRAQTLGTRVGLAPAPCSCLQGLACPRSHPASGGLCRWLPQSEPESLGVPEDGGRGRGSLGSPPCPQLPQTLPTRSSGITGCRMGVHLTLPQFSWELDSPPGPHRTQRGHGPQHGFCLQS